MKTPLQSVNKLYRWMGGADGTDGWEGLNRWMGGADGTDGWGGCW